MAVSLPCSVQNFKMIEQLRIKLWANKYCVSDGFGGQISNIVTATRGSYNDVWAARTIVLSDNKCHSEELLILIENLGPGPMPPMPFHGNFHFKEDSFCGLI